MKRTTPVPSIPPLTATEQRAISAFRKMDARRKREVLQYMESEAKSHPQYIAPTLRLVIGGAE